MGDIVVITGNIGTGKTAIIRYMGALGLQVYNADFFIAKDLEEKGTLYQAAIKIFGANNVLDSDGNFDRRRFIRLQILHKAKKYQWYDVAYGFVYDTVKAIADKSPTIVYLENALHFECGQAVANPHMQVVVLTAPSSVTIPRAIQSKQATWNGSDEDLWAWVEIVLADQFSPKYIEHNFSDIKKYFMPTDLYSVEQIVTDITWKTSLFEEKHLTPQPLNEQMEAIARETIYNALVFNREWKVHGLGMIQFPVPEKLVKAGNDLFYIHVHSPKLSLFSRQESMHSHACHMRSSVLTGWIANAYPIVTAHSHELPNSSTTFQQVIFPTTPQETISVLPNANIVETPPRMIYPGETYSMKAGSPHLAYSGKDKGLTITFVQKSQPIMHSIGYFPLGSKPAWGKDPINEGKLKDIARSIFPELLGIVRNWPDIMKLDKSNFSYEKPFEYCPL